MWRADRPKTAAGAAGTAAALPDPGPEPEPDLEAAGAFPVYRRALLANVLNPKAAAIYLTLAPQFLDPARPIAGQVLLLATAQGALVAAWLTGWTAVLSGARRLLGAPRARRTWTRVSACVLVILGVRNAAA
jgi:threonine/homoserine/homoserine lactone efflux protein